MKLYEKATKIYMKIENMKNYEQPYEIVSVLSRYFDLLAVRNEFNFLHHTKLLKVN